MSKLPESERFDIDPKEVGYGLAFALVSAVFVVCSAWWITKDIFRPRSMSWLFILVVAVFVALLAYCGCVVGSRTEPKP